MKKTKDLFIKNIKRKRVWIPLTIILVVVALFAFKPDSSIKNTVTDVAKYTDLKQTILATGQVVSNTDLNLSFNTSGVVKSIKVKVGDTVKAGQVLATLDQSSVLASLTSARGALAAANARYKRTLEGATSEEITLAQVALDQTKLSQDTLVKNAYKSLLNSTPEAFPKDVTSNYTAPVISGNYSLGKEGIIYLTLYYSSGGVSFSTTGLVESSGVANTITPQPLGNSGLYITFASDTRIEEKEWVIEIPNKKASDYLTNYNAYQAALSQAKFAIDQKEAELNLKKATARPSDIDLARADILSAEGQVQLATSRYNDTLITAPLDGTITSIDIKTGELAQALKEVIVLQDVSNIYLEANVNEANIANLSVGLPVDISYDAFGSEIIFKGNITKIDPSSTVISGVVNYKITASVEQSDNLRPGMTANMTIKAKEKNHVITVPSRAILVDTDGSKTIRVIANSKTKKFVEVPITTGLEGDGGVVEVASGLNADEEFVVLIKAE